MNDISYSSHLRSSLESNAVVTDNLSIVFCILTIVLLIAILVMAILCFITLRDIQHRIEDEI